MLAPASFSPQLPLGTSLARSTRMSLLTCKLRGAQGLLRQEDRRVTHHGGIPSGSGSESRKSSARDICSGAFADAAEPWPLSFRKDFISSAVEHGISLHRRQSCFVLAQ